MGYGSDNAPGTSNLKVGDTVKYVGSESAKLIGKEGVINRLLYCESAMVDFGDFVAYPFLSNLKLVSSFDQRDARIAELTDLLEYHKHDAKCAGEEVQDLNAQLSEKAARIAELEAKLKTAQGTCVRLNWEQWDLKKERDDLTKRVVELEAQHSEFCKTMDWMQTELTKERRRNQFPDTALRTEQECDELRARLDEQARDTLVTLDENAELRAQLEHVIDREEKWYNEAVFTNQQLAAVTAERDALKPKPVVEVCYTKLGTKLINHFQLDYEKRFDDNLKLTFEDGKLVDSEVLK